MWAKLFGKKIETAVEDAVAEQAKLVIPHEETLQIALQTAKDKALESILRSEVEKKLSELYIGETFQQSVLACKTLDKIKNSDEFKIVVRDSGWDDAHEEAFQTVRRMYPKAVISSDGLGNPNFREPHLCVHDIVNSISDTILKGMKE